jgi:cytoskeletal protein CcmA (bactofilin family)
MLQRDGLFRRREEPALRPTPSAAPSTPETPALRVETKPAEKPAEKSDKSSEERKEAKLIVGPDIKMKGVEVTDCDTLVVEGRMEATLDSRVIEIAPNGTFCGTVAVDSAEIHGRLEGELTVRKQLVIHGTGKVSGKIRYARIRIEEGAELSGEISMLDKDKAAQPASSFQRKVS